MAADHWNAQAYGETARFVSDLGAPVLELLAPEPGERILDLGCGDGALTQALADTGAEVLGVDASADMVGATRARGIPAELADARKLDFDAGFDAVFSNAALHWMTDPDAVLRGVFRALKPGGRFVAEAGGHGNVAAIQTALAAALDRSGASPDLGDIWYFPSAQEQKRRLEAAGFTVSSVELIPRPTRIDAGMAAWLATLAAPVLARLPDGDAAALTRNVVQALEPVLRDGEGVWWADYVRIRFAAGKPADS